MNRDRRTLVRENRGKTLFWKIFLEKLAVALIFPRNNSIIFEPNNIIKANQDHGSCTVKIAARVKALLLI